MYADCWSVYRVSCVVPCVLRVAYCLWYVGCCILCIACGTFDTVCCTLHAAFCMFHIHVACFIFQGTCCMLHIACAPASMSFKLYAKMRIQVRLPRPTPSKPQICSHGSCYVHRCELGQFVMRFPFCKVIVRSDLCSHRL